MSKHRSTELFSIIIGAVLSLLVILLFIKPNTLDNLILLENKNPSYFNWLMPENAIYVSYNGDVSSNVGAVPDNKFIHNNDLSFPEGFLVDYYSDGSFSLSGTSKETKAVILTPANYYLPDGDYYVSCGNGIDWGGIQFYFEGRLKKTSGDNLIESIYLNDTNHIIHIDNNRYSSIVFCLAFTEGFSADGILLQPLVRPYIGNDIEYSFTSCFNADGEGTIIRLNYYKGNLTDSDLKLYCNSLNEDRGKNGWSSIVDSRTHYGIQFKDFDQNSYTEGYTDTFGRIIE